MTPCDSVLRIGEREPDGVDILFSQLLGDENQSAVMVLKWTLFGPFGETGRRIGDILNTVDYPGEGIAGDVHESLDPQDFRAVHL